MADQKFLKNILGETPPDSEEKSFTKERQHTAQAFALHVDYRDGLSKEGVAWSHFGRYRWQDFGTHESLRIIFGGLCGLEITGQGLMPLVEQVKQGQLNGIKEMLSSQAKLGESEPIITSIKAYPDFDALFEALKAEGEEEEHEHSHTRSVRGR